MINNVKKFYFDLSIKKIEKENTIYRIIKVEERNINNENYISQIYSVLQVLFEAALLTFNWKNIKEFEEFVKEIKLHNYSFVIKTENHLQSEFFTLESSSLDSFIKGE